MIRTQLVKYIFAIHASTRTWLHETYGHVSIVKLTETVKHRVECNSEHFKINGITLPQIKLSYHIPQIAAPTPQIIDIHKFSFRSDLILQRNWNILKWHMKAGSPVNNSTTPEITISCPLNLLLPNFFSPENVCKHKNTIKHKFCLFIYLFIFQAGS